MRRYSYAIVDDSRFVKAKKIIACLQLMCNDLQDKEALEIGCGSGIISSEISKTVKHMTAIDIADEALKKAMQSNNLPELPFQFIIGDGTRLPFLDTSFDIIVCNQVFEHVRNQDKLIAEVYRVLKLDGICYIATANKLWPLEPHTKLPFLSYLPKSIADKYIRKFRGPNEYDVFLPTYWKLRRIISNKFDLIIDLTSIVIKYPEKFYITNEIPKSVRGILTKIPLWLLQIFVPLSPSWIIIGIKKSLD